MDQFIQIYEKAFSDEFCNKFIEYYNMVEQMGLTINRQDHDKAIKIDKEDEAIFIPSYPLAHAEVSLIKEFDNIFWQNCYKNYGNKFSILQTFAEHSSFMSKIQKTKPGQGYHVWHSEATHRNNCNRLLTWTVYLNDDFEAGETEFLYQQYRYKPQKGDCIIFPAAYTHTHRGNPPIGGDKYIITGWVEF